MVCISWVCVSLSGLNKNCHLNSELCLFGSISKEGREKIWPKVYNTFSPSLGGFSNVPKLKSILLIQNRQKSWHSTSTYSSWQGRVGIFMSWHLVLREWHNCPFSFYLCSIKNTQCNQKFFKIVLLGCFVCLFVFLMAYCHETASPYFIFFIVIIIFPNTTLTMTSIFNVRIEAVKRFA